MGDRNLSHTGYWHTKLQTLFGFPVFPLTLPFCSKTPSRIPQFSRLLRCPWSVTASQSFLIYHSLEEGWLGILQNALQSGFVWCFVPDQTRVMSLEGKNQRWGSLPITTNQSLHDRTVTGMSACISWLMWCLLGFSTEKRQYLASPTRILEVSH